MLGSYCLELRQPGRTNHTHPPPQTRISRKNMDTIQNTNNNLEKGSKTIRSVPVRGIEVFLQCINDFEIIINNTVWGHIGRLDQFALQGSCPWSVLSVTSSAPHPYAPLKWIWAHERENIKKETQTDLLQAWSLLERLAGNPGWLIMID